MSREKERSNFMQENKKKILKQNIEFLVPGVQIARDVCSESDSVLVSAGTITNNNLIEKLKNWDIQSIDIIEEVSANPIIDPKLQKFLNSYNQSVSVMKKTFADIRQTQDVSMETFTNTAEEITESLPTGGNVIDRLYDLPACDDYTFRHSVNVSAISALLGTWLKFPPESVSAIALAALLHDVGKSQLPVELLNKPYKLSPEDYKIYQTHTQLGVDLVKKQGEIAESILAGIDQHHEREDGRGYPAGLKSVDIHPYAKIIAVADRFDEALTINCENPSEVSPYSSLDKLREEQYYLDPHSCITFRENMMNYISGQQVMLTNKMGARVVFINKERPSLSIVQTNEGEVWDLSTMKDVCIQYVMK